MFASATHSGADAHGRTNGTGRLRVRELGADQRTAGPSKPQSWEAEGPGPSELLIFPGELGT